MGHLFENVVYLQFLCRGWYVHVGQLCEKEGDFVAVKDERIVYFQVTDEMLSEAIRERELKPLRSIRDSYEKLIVVRQGRYESDIGGIKMRLRELAWVVASPPRWRGPQVRAPEHHGGHGAVDVVGPVAPPGRASGRGYAGVYTDRRKWPLGATTARMQNAPFRDVSRPECASRSRCGGVAGAERAFP